MWWQTVVMPLWFSSSEHAISRLRHMQLDFGLGFKISNLKSRVLLR